MEFKGTKGKWVVKHLYDVFIENEFGEQICEMPAKEIIRYETWRENAQLISKAPEMLEMLKEIRDQIEDGRTYITKSDIDKLIQEATEL